MRADAAGGAAGLCWAEGALCWRECTPQGPHRAPRALCPRDFALLGQQYRWALGKLCPRDCALLDRPRRRCASPGHHVPLAATPPGDDGVPREWRRPPVGGEGGGDRSGSGDRLSSMGCLCPGCCCRQDVACLSPFACSCCDADGPPLPAPCSGSCCCSPLPRCRFHRHCHCSCCCRYWSHCVNCHRCHSHSHFHSRCCCCYCCCFQPLRPRFHRRNQTSSGEQQPLLRRRPLHCHPGRAVLRVV